MLPYPNINPVLIAFGPFQIRWYGIMYLLGFVFSYGIVRHELTRQKVVNLTKDQLLDLYFFLILGLILGARLGYVLFYNFKEYLQHPLEVVAVWHGGMSFHGGLAGVVLSGWLFCRRNKIPIFALGDLLVLTAPIGLGLGRLANFINGELFGRVTSVPWGMVFPQGGPLPRHPSQLYEAFLEGVVLFILLWIRRNHKKFQGELLADFLILYGFFRFVVEFFREPDIQIGYLWGFLTMGQLLSGIMILGGGLLFLILWRREKSRPGQTD
jgi:phosphatidylglycerol:prolipoprotein diacylglycerol transferase